jgi:hypothetical protein
MPHVITNCTARKRGAADALVMTPELVGTSLQDMAVRWSAAVNRQTAHREAVELYTGRSVSEARQAAIHVNASLFFVSAGLGLIAATQKVPPYDLTPVQATGGLAGAIQKHGASAAGWWSCLSGNAVSALVGAKASELFLLALPATYLRMLASDLAQVSAGDVERLRIFTSPAGAEEVPEALRKSVMPYDERLESIPTYAGTQADFPQRALRHFVQELGGTPKSLRTSRDRVSRALAGIEIRRIPERRRLDDAQIKVLIRQRWHGCKGKGALLLRALRDEELVACEQGRFSELWREVKQKMNAGVQRRVAR